MPHPHQHALQRDPRHPTGPSKIHPKKYFSDQEDLFVYRKKTGQGLQTPAGLICLVSHSPQLSLPQHLDTVKHLADPDKIQQAFAAGFRRNPQWILAPFKAVRSELGLVKKGDASCNQRLPLTSI